MADCIIIDGVFVKISEIHKKFSQEDLNIAYKEMYDYEKYMPGPKN